MIRRDPFRLSAVRLTVVPILCEQNPFDRFRSTTYYIISDIREESHTYYTYTSDIGIVQPRGDDGL